MKKILILASLLLAAMGSGAQTIYDASAISQKDLNGTARFVGMGGALSALGGDISTIGTNPAGIGIYRSNDLMLSMGYSITGSESDYLGNKFEINKHRWGFDNIGVVIATKIGNETPLRYMNFGFNYHKSKSFYKNMTMEGMLGMIDMGGNSVPVSQVRYMAQQATNGQYLLHQATGGREQFDYGTSSIYNDPDAGWLGAMGYQGWLTDEVGDASPYAYSPIVPSEANGFYRSRERGGIDQYDFNMAFNINDRFYFGVTVGAYCVDYNKYSLYDEAYDTGEGYSLESFNRIHGSGFDVKFGTIVRPFEELPLRVGLAVHTPTYYDLTYTTGALLTSDVLMEDENSGAVTEERYSVDTFDKLGGRDMDRDYRLQTPWLFNASLGYTVGRELALGAEYEYEDYSTMKFKYPEGDEMWHETNEASTCLKGVSTLRLGAEWKVVPSFAMRAGYNYSTAIFKNDAVKYLADNSISTDTDFANSKSMNTFTFGVGYRISSFYADVAFKYQSYKSDFYPFFNEMTNDAANDYMVDPARYSADLVTPQATKVTNSRSQVVVTLGFRF